MSKILESRVDLDAPYHDCASCGDGLNPTLQNQAMCHKCAEHWHERRRRAEKEVILLIAENERHLRHIQELFASKMRVTDMELSQMTHNHALHAAGMCERPEISDELLGRMIHDLNFLSGPTKRKKGDDE